MKLSPCKKALIYAIRLLIAIPQVMGYLLYIDSLGSWSFYESLCVALSMAIGIYYVLGDMGEKPKLE